MKTLSRDADPQEIARLVERGEYVIDHRAVAEAMLRQSGERWRRLSAVFVPGERDRPAGRVEQIHPRPGRNGS